MAATNLKLNLTIDTENNKVLFAIPDKDFLDFLFSLLSLPLSTVTRLLSRDHSVLGSLGKLHESIEKLDHMFFLPNLNTRDTLLKPKSPIHHLLMTKDDNESAATDDGGYVRKHATYFLMDNLQVKAPLSTSYMLPLILVKKFDPEDGTVKQRWLKVEERCVDVGRDEALKLLKSSLESKTVLTDVFLGKKEAKAEVEAEAEAALVQSCVSSGNDSLEYEWDFCG
ncbi:uncharacterized protein LOC133714703 isoform X2 [Rosa rugosa]|uniref:uncharacterized protein LOC133714703 isoform X2 n=1 Tax=Rosa rugosa TaxID=74645 RepID=UPI002B400DDB|nr:uncharacterized protein LOC133714703 isoform X2 [Rosa rugosa]